MRRLTFALLLLLLLPASARADQVVINDQARHTMIPGPAGTLPAAQGGSHAFFGIDFSPDGPLDPSGTAGLPSPLASVAFASIDAAKPDALGFVVYDPRGQALTRSQPATPRSTPDTQGLQDVSMIRNAVVTPVLLPGCCPPGLPPAVAWGRYIVDVYNFTGRDVGYRTSSTLLPLRPTTVGASTQTASNVDAKLLLGRINTLYPMLNGDLEPGLS